MNNYSMKIKINIIYILRKLQKYSPINNNQTIINKNDQKRQLRDLYIYLAILVVIIIVIIGGYAIYRKCVEKKVLEEIEREYQIMLMNLLNSNSSISSSQEDKRPHSYNNENPQHLQNIDELNNQQFYNSLDQNHEERMENIRKKFGNHLVIKCLLKKQIEEINYTKNFAEDYGDICTICMENFVENIIICKTPCEHIFHKKCFDTYLKEIEKKDKLVCPNCNQNLLINKKFLKLRVKNKKIEVKKISKKEIKESELNLENEYRNRMSVATNKNEDNIFNNSNNEIILLKKKSKKDKIKIDNKIDDLNIKNKKENNIYNPLQIRVKKINIESKKDNDTIVPNNDKDENIDINKKNKKKIVILNNMEKKNNNNNLKLSINSIESNVGLYNNKKRILNSINSERDKVMFSKNTCVPFMSTSKQDNI